jgi:hypothetical protein
MHNRQSWLALLTVAGLGSGCVDFEANETAPLPAMGELRVDYTIRGESEPDACELARADTFELLVYTHRAEADHYERTPPASRMTAACADFAVRIDLPAGDYRARASLYAPDGDLALHPIDIPAFAIIPDGAVARKLAFATNDRRQ